MHGAEGINMIETLMLPWRVVYRPRCKEWHRHSRPCVVNRNDAIILEPTQFVFHAGEYDILADSICKLVVSRANDIGRAEAESILAPIFAAEEAAMARVSPMWKM